MGAGRDARGNDRWRLDEELAREMAAHGGPAASPTYMFSRAAARALDREAIESLGLPGVVLMENAALAVASAALDMLAHAGSATCLVICGPGHNGGDGLAAARHLRNAGADVRIATTASDDAFTPDAATHLGVARRAGYPLTRLSTNDPPGDLAKILHTAGPIGLVIDAMVGSGLSGSLRDPHASLVPAINALRPGGTLVLAVDIPTGLDADSGLPLGSTIVADVTVTLAGVKQGFDALEAQNYLGEVIVGDIGVPASLLAKHGTLAAPDQTAAGRAEPRGPARGRTPPESPPRNRAPRGR